MLEGTQNIEDSYSVQGIPDIEEQLKSSAKYQNVSTRTKTKEKSTKCQATTPKHLKRRVTKLIGKVGDNVPLKSILLDPNHEKRNLRVTFIDNVETDEGEKELSEDSTSPSPNVTPIPENSSHSQPDSSVWSEVKLDNFVYFSGYDHCLNNEYYDLLSLLN